MNPTNLALAKLDRLLAERRMTTAHLARALGLPRSTITAWCCGRVPRKDRIEKIREWSGGVILASDWYDPFYGAKPIRVYDGVTRP